MASMPIERNLALAPIDNVRPWESAQLEAMETLVMQKMAISFYSERVRRIGKQLCHFLFMMYLTQDGFMSQT